MRGRHHRRNLLIGVVASIAALVATTSYIQLQASKSWRDMVALGQDLREQWLQRPQARLPLWGEATDESAFEHYRRAAELIKPLDDQRKTLGKMLRDSDAEIALRCMDLRAAWRPSLSAMRLGAHSLRALDLTATSPGEGVYPLIHYRSVSNAAALEARILRHEGDLAGSIRLTLDTMAMASDIFHSGVLINQMNVAEVVFNFLFVGQLTGLKNKNAEPLSTHVRRECCFRFLIFWPAYWANK